MRTILLCWLGTLALLGSGCATITAGTSGTQRLGVDTDPPGATATAGAQRCTTPCSLVLPRRQDAAVVLAGEGRAPQEVRLRSRLRLAAAANAVWLPLALPFLGLDLAMGAAWELVPPDLRLTLEPADPAAPGSPRPPLTPAPRPKRAATLMVEFGAASTSGTTLSGLGAVLTVPVGGPWVVGAEAFRGSTMTFNDTDDAGSLYGLLGGLEASWDSVHASLLLRLAVGTGHPEAARTTTVTLPQAALRGEVSLLAADVLLIGLWATAGTELGQRTVANPAGPAARIGGRVFGGGLSVGVVLPSRAFSADRDPP